LTTKGQTPTPPKVVVFKTKVYFTKADQRFRLNPLPTEIVRVARDLENKEVWAVLYALDREITITLPWIITKHVKHLILNAKSDKDVKDLFSFIGYDVINSYLRLLLPNIPTVMLRDPDVEIKKIKIEGVDGIWVRATEFTVYPYPAPEGEKRTDAIIVEGEIYDLPDERDMFTWSYVTVKINLKQLIDEIGIRWDLARG